jgi:phosphonate transport system permease protein
MKRRPSKSAWWISGALCICAIVGAKKMGFDLTTIKGLASESGPTISKYTHPNWDNLPRLLGLLAQTVAMGIIGSIITMILAIPATTVAAKNLAPNRFIYAFTRQVLNFFRSMPDALIALVLVQGLGLGPLPGAIALGLHSSGYIAKSLSEKIERVDPKVYEGLKSCGASWFQTIRFGAWPSIEREIVADALFILDRNIRVAATLGIVGAGGIGVELLADLRTFHTNEAATVILLIVVMVVIVDTSSSYARRRMG